MRPSVDVQNFTGYDNRAAWPGDLVHGGLENVPVPDHGLQLATLKECCIGGKHIYLFSSNGRATDNSTS